VSDDPEREQQGGEAEIDDQPLGVQEDAEPDEAPLPGVPEKEPPNSG
jgi:hypothetical protein